MYQYIHALVREPGRTGRWVEANLGNRIVSEVWHSYRDVYLAITHQAFNGEEKAVRLFDIPTSLGGNRSTLTVADWLVSISDKGLPLLDEMPKIQTVYAPYRDAWQAGYSIEPINRTVHHDVMLPLSDRPDLRLTKEGVDYQKLFDECLVTVNGIFHRTNYATTGLHVLDGAKSGFHANKTQVGLYRLGKLGKITTVPILEENVHKGLDDQKLGEYAYVTLDDSVDIENKTVFMVIGGYLHTIGDVYYRAGERTYVVDFNNYPLAQRFYESRKLFDYSEVEKHLSKSSVNADQVAVDELYSDDVIRSILTLPQSFFVVIDAPDIFIEREQLQFMNIPGRFLTTQVPDYPMIVGLGRVAEYWVRHEEGQYVLACQDDHVTNYLFETTRWKEENSIDSSRVPYNLTDQSRAHLLKVGKDL